MEIFGGVFLMVVLSAIMVYMALEKKENKEEVISENDELWEILVPASSKEKEFSYEHHKNWDTYVKSLAGGLTIMKTAKGEWINPDGVLYLDRMIPVRIKCKYSDIQKIVDFTIKHYDQEAVLAYMISREIILKHKKEL
jgi:hypothetical protein